MESHCENVMVVSYFKNRYPATENGKTYAGVCNLRDIPFPVDIVVLPYTENQKSADVIINMSIDEFALKNSQLPVSGSDDKPTDEFIQPLIDESGHNFSHLPAGKSYEKSIDEFIQLPGDESVQARADENTERSAQVIPVEGKKQVPFDHNVNVIVNWEGQISDNESSHSSADGAVQNSVDQKNIQMLCEEAFQTFSNNPTSFLYLKEQSYFDEKNQDPSGGNLHTFVNPRCEMLAYGNSHNILARARQVFNDENRYQIFHEETFQAPPNRTIDFVSLKEQILQSKNKQQSSDGILKVFVPRISEAFAYGSSYNSVDEVHKFSINESKVQKSHESTIQAPPNSTINSVNMKKPVIRSRSDQQSFDENNHSSLDEIPQVSGGKRTTWLYHNEAFLARPNKSFKFNNLRKKMFYDENEQASLDGNAKVNVDLKDQLPFDGSGHESVNETSIRMHNKKTLQSPLPKSINTVTGRDQRVPNRNDQMLAWNCLITQRRILINLNERQRVHLISFSMVIALLISFIIAMLICWLA